AVHAQTECRADPHDPALEFFAHPGGRTLEFRSQRPAQTLAHTRELALDCVVRGSPSTIDYLIMPQRAGDPPAVWNIRRVDFTFFEGGEQRCGVTATYA